MALTERSRNKIYETFNTLIDDEQAVEEMLSYFPARDVEEPVSKDHLTSQLLATRNDLKTEIAATRSELMGEIAVLRQELHAEIGSLRTDMHAELGKLDTQTGSLRTELKGDIADLRTDMHVEMGKLVTKMNLNTIALFTTMIAMQAALIGAVLFRG